MNDATKTEAPGPWEPAIYCGYSTRYWTLRRKNPAWWGGTEQMLTRNGSPRRFGSEDSARKAIPKDPDHA